MTLTMIAKELRENLRTAVVGLLLVAAAVTLALFKSAVDTDPRAATGIVSVLFQVLTTLVCPIVGFTIGLTTVRHESRRDRWSFLAHRPVTRTQIFLAKASAALTLYAAAAGLPIAAACLFHATPGHFPYPFAPAMLLPPLADLAAGAVYVFAGMAIAMRQASWLRTRILPLSIAGIASVCVLATPSFAYAMLGVAICGAILATAAWGQLLTGGHWHGQPRPAKAATFFSITTGIVVTGAIAVAIAYGIYESALLPEHSSQFHVLGPSGKAYLVTTRGGKTVTAEPLPGGPDAPPDELAAVRDGHRALNTTTLALSPDRTRLDWHSYRDDARHAQLLGTVDDVAWYYVHTARRVAGYDLRGKRVVATAGPDGFAPGPDARPFDEPALRSPSGLAGGVIAFPSAVYTISPRTRTIQRVFQSSPDQSIHDAVRFRGDANQLFTLIAAGPNLHILTGSDHTATIALAHGPSRSNTAWVGATTDSRLVLWTRPGQWSPAEPGQIATYSSDGQKLTDQPLPAIADPSNLAEDLTAGVGIPLAFAIAAAAIAAPFGHDPFDAATLSLVAVSILAGLVAAALSRTITRRHALPTPARTAWTLTTFFFGFAGLLAMLAVRDWPARLPCPNCGNRRPVDTDTCPHCAQPWPPPTPDGTEILEPAAVAEPVTI